MDVVRGSVVVVTGGTGSFGSTVVRELLASEVAEIRVLSRDESKHETLQKCHDDDRLRMFLGDVRDPDSLAPAFDGADYVFHAAALKQVPRCEQFPLEAVKTNVLGSSNVLAMAVRSSIERAVFLSTDKAVYPLNAMGQSKAMMEKIVMAEATRGNHGTTLSIVRYGNVMCSRGSVIPHFATALLEGRSLTITDLSMTRFMMSLTQSVTLVERALSGGPGGLYVMKAPAATVEAIALGVALALDLPIPALQISGPRPGEKVHETLLTTQEMARSLEREDHFHVPPEEPGDHRPDVDSVDEYRSDNVRMMSAEEVAAVLTDLVEFQPFLSKRHAQRG